MLQTALTGRIRPIETPHKRPFGRLGSGGPEIPILRTGLKLSQGDVRRARASTEPGCRHDPTTPGPTKDNSRAADLMVIFFLMEIIFEP